MPDLVSVILAPGMMVLQICSVDVIEQRGQILIDPDFVVAIYHDRDTPDGCTKILTSSGRTVFVYGGEQEVAAARNQALHERSQIAPR